MRKSCFLLLFIAASAASFAADRFSGTANLSASKAQTSANADGKIVIVGFARSIT